MNTERTEKKRAFIINVFFYAIIIGLVYLLFKYVVVWLLPFIIGLGIALLFKPVINFLVSHTKINRRICACLVVILGYTLLALLIWLLGYRIVEALKGFFASLPDYYNNNIFPFFENVNQYLTDKAGSLSPDLLVQIYSMTENITQAIKNFIMSVSKGMVTYLANVTAKVPMFLISFIFTILSSIFISMDFSKISSFIGRQIPPKIKGVLSDIREHMLKTLLSYLKAYLILMFITFTELSIGLSLLRVQNAIGIAILIAIADALPVIGTGGILIPWSIFSFVNGDIFMGIGLLIIYAIVILVRNFIEPKVVGDQLGLHPLVTIIAIYLGFSWFGVVGMIGVPITLNIIVGLHRSGKLRIWVD